MLRVKWDNELAAVAQRWAEQCLFAHDQSRDVERFPVGQNLYETTRPKDSALTAMIREAVMGLTGWYSEVMSFNPAGIDRYQFSPTTGHYTQLVWAKTNRIGCGHISYDMSGSVKKLLVCNYGPSGNFVGQRMYTRAPPCSQCDVDEVCGLQQEVGLCGKSRIIFDPN